MREHAHPITTPEALPIGQGAEVLDLQEVTEATSLLDAIVERAGARVGTLRRLLSEAQTLEAELEAGTERLRDYLERTCDVSRRLEDRIRHADGLVQRLDSLATADLARTVADLDRQAAQVQARIGVMVDAAEERVRQLHRDAASVDSEGRRAERLSIAADHLLRMLGKVREADSALERRIEEARRERKALESGALEGD